MASATSSAFRAGAASRRASTDRAAAPTRCAASTAVCAALCEALTAPGQRSPVRLRRERVRVEIAHAGHAVRRRRPSHQVGRGPLRRSPHGRQPPRRPRSRAPSGRRRQTSRARRPPPSPASGASTLISRSRSAPGPLIAPSPANPVPPSLLEARATQARAATRHRRRGRRCKVLGAASPRWSARLSGSPRPGVIRLSDAGGFLGRAGAVASATGPSRRRREAEEQKNE